MILLFTNFKSLLGIEPDILVPSVSLYVVTHRSVVTATLQESTEAYLYLCKQVLQNFLSHYVFKYFTADLLSSARHAGLEFFINV